MSSIVAITILAFASAGSYGNYKKSVYIGTPCECNASVLEYARIYDPSASPHDGTYAGECKGESVDPLDVWNGLGVEFYGFLDDHKNFDATFKYQIDCALPCSIQEVHIEGTAFSDATWFEMESTSMPGPDGRQLLGEFKTTLNQATICLTGGDCCTTCRPPNSKSNEPGGECCYIKEHLDNSQHAVISIDRMTANNGFGQQKYFPTDYVQQFTIIEYQPYNYAATDEWRCRNSLSIVASASVEPAFGCNSRDPRGLEFYRDPDTDCGPAESSILARKPITTATPTTTPTTTPESTDSSEDSREDSSDCHTDDDCSGSQVCDAFECVESKLSSGDPSSSDDSSNDSSDDSGDDSSTVSSDQSSRSTHCHSHDDCPGMQICNPLSFECEDDSSEDSESSEDSRSVACELVEARLDECEAMQELILSILAGGEESEESEDNEEEEVAPLSAPAGSGFGAKEALIVCLVLTNVVLLAYVCLGKSSMAKNKPVYGGVPGTETEQEDLCA